MKIIKCVLIDDEPRNLELLSYYINKYCPNLSIVDQFSERHKAEAFFNDDGNDQQIDILFLDLILDNGTGFDLMDNIDYSDMHIVICTAHDEFAMKAIQYEVVDYMLKPIEIQDLKQTLEKINERIQKKEKFLFDANSVSKFANTPLRIIRPVVIKNKKMIELVPAKEIVFIESSTGDGKKSALVMRDESVKHCSMMLNKMESILDTTIFFRLNRSYIVNLHEISKIERGVNYVCVMSNGFKLPVPRARYRTLLNEIEGLFGLSI